MNEERDQQQVVCVRVLSEEFVVVSSYMSNGRSADALCRYDEVVRDKNESLVLRDGLSSCNAHQPFAEDARKLDFGKDSPIGA